MPAFTQNGGAEVFRVGTGGNPGAIAQSLPEDLKYSAQVAHPTDYQDPDPPAEFMISAKVFEKPDSAHLLEP